MCTFEFAYLPPPPPRPPSPVPIPVPQESIYAVHINRDMIFVRTELTCAQ